MIKLHDTDNKMQKKKPNSTLFMEKLEKLIVGLVTVFKFMTTLLSKDCKLHEKFVKSLNNF